METKATCPYCGVGCGVLIEHDGQQVTGVRGDPAHPANYGALCSKGSTLHLTVARTSRALYPELRLSRDAARQRITWDGALDHAAARFAAIIREHGPDAVAFYVSGQLLTEDYFVFNKLARALVGTNNIDSNSRLCMSSAVAGYKQTLGADAPPCNYQDVETADLVLVAGANPAVAHPVLFSRLMAAREARAKDAARPPQKLVVIDPRRTDTAAAADLHLAIEPGTDTVLFGALLHVLIWDGLVDRRYINAHTTGFEAARDAVRELTPAAAAQVCGLGDQGAADIVTAAHWFGEAGNALSLWCQGLNQSAHGTANSAALIHLHLATGQLGRPGAGPFSLTGQPNAMGGRESGTMANLLPGHREPGNAVHRAEVAAAWGVPALPEHPGLPAVELFDALHAGRVKAVWIACTNPAQSLPTQAKIRAALEKAEFVVLQEAYADTETAAYADLLLPAATWAEKDGTVTNSERRISRVRAAIPAPGEARPDWAIAGDFARRLGAALGRDDAPRLFAFSKPEDVFREHAALTAGRDLDYSGLSYALLETQGPQQWPFPTGATAGTPRLYADGRFPHADGKAHFVPLIPAGQKGLATVAEARDARYPLALTTGRLRDQWHGMSRTGKAARLYNHTEHALLSLNPADIVRRGLTAGDLVEITGRRGTVILPLAADPGLKPGHAFLPMHWGRARLSNAGANELTLGTNDPVSKQPELKHAAIAVRPAALPWRGLLLRAADGPTASEQVLAWMERLRPALTRFAYASLGLAGRERNLVALHLAHGEAPPAEWLADLDHAAELDGEDILSYADARRGISKKVRVDAGRLTGVRLAGETAAAGWLKDTLLAGADAAPLRRWLLAPVTTPPAGQKTRGRIVCNCFDVSENEIGEAAAAGCGTLDALQDKLKCGTNCGACVQEIRGLLARHPAAAGAIEMPLR